MGRWAQAGRRGSDRSLSATPKILAATVDPGAYGPTDGVLICTFDRPLTTCDATDLEAAQVSTGTFTFGSAPSFVPGGINATWTSTAFTAGSPATTRLDWTGTDGPIVFFGGSTLSAIVNFPVVFI